MKKKSILVAFGNKPPKRHKSYFDNFDEVLTGEALEEFINPGSIQKAYESINTLSRLIMADGSRLSKLITYQGYEIWWMDYDTIYEQFCLPYTKFRNLLAYLKNFEKIYLFGAPSPHLFQYFLKVHHRQCIILKPFCLRRLFRVPLGGYIQIIFSFLFLPWLAIGNNRIMFWINDKFNPPHDFDFRKKFIYEELRKRKIPFVEFIRSSESWLVILQHAWKRRRPVIYATAIIDLLHFIGRYLPGNKKKILNDLSFSTDADQYFWRLVSIHYLRNSQGTILGIRAMKLILQYSKIKSAIMISGGDRTFPSILACKSAGIPTVGIQHGLAPRYFLVADFMPEFDGEKSLSLDEYGLWSAWWREYYLKYSRVFKPDQLFISGSPRPIKEGIARAISAPAQTMPRRPLKVLFISEQVAEPKEIIPNLMALLNTKDFTIFLKFRPQTDIFEEWLKKNEPNILGKVKILRGDIHQAISESDVIVGSYSTAVLEGLAQLRPVVFFRTKKWGDYLDLKSLNSSGCFFAENYEELIWAVRKSPDVSMEELKKLRAQFFGDPRQNGAAWIVERAAKFLSSFE